MSSQQLNRLSATLIKIFGLPIPHTADYTTLTMFLVEHIRYCHAITYCGCSGYPTDTNEVGGSAIATYSPQGGYGSANIFPKPEGGLDNRFGGGDDSPQNSLGAPVSSVSGSFKPPGSSSFGVFTSSASGSSDVNGKKTSFKQSTLGVNDNGKVTTYTAHNP